MFCIPVLPRREMTVEEFKTWLNRFDMDMDGKISRDELKQALHSLNSWFGWWKARRVMKEADENGDGHIDNDKEVEKLIAYAERHLSIKIYESPWAERRFQAPVELNEG
ncbi:hypothetical protein Syun_015341 [Stephania yunnanensis]|uniref:EF-hand domain-containing protein n=1 Tax=Stephania yunnanensis TaxID=152371 RepID=A0AAP0JKZ4_9MAGN